MAKTLKEVMDELPPARQAKIRARAAQLIAEEQTLQDLRRAMKRTQAAVAKQLKIKQENVSRLESRTDLLLSTLEQYVSALGGKLHFIAEFPNRPPVRIKRIGTLASQDPLGKRHTRRRAA
jgi:transcriptional regulator with XRE-family HTH domain